MKRILWFSPVPPAKTDIGNYSARLAPYLAKHFSVQFCVPDELPWTETLPCKPISSLTAKELNSADLCVYHLGNNAQFHSQIFEWASKHPGIVVLHDRAIHEFYLGQLNIWNDTQYPSKIRQYLETMARWYGEAGYRAAEAVCDGSKRPTDYAAAFPLYEVAVENALAVLCHNPSVSAEIRQRFPLLPVLDLPLPYPASKEMRARNTEQIKKPIRLIAFGFIGANRRLIPFLNAWAASPQREDFTLDVAGEVSELEHFIAEVEKLGLIKQVFQHGFVSDARLDEILQSAHLAINLRYPTMGEASGSQLRIWANEIASVVTDVGWYEQLPNETVIKIRPNHEHDDILDLLEKLSLGTIDLAPIASAGAQRLQRHAPEQYAIEFAKWYSQEGENLKRRWILREQIRSLAEKNAELLPPDQFLPIPASLASSAR